MENLSAHLSGARLGILPIDLPSSGFGVYPIDECPNEVLISVAEYLENRSLVAFALVSKRMAGVAQDVLYRCVVLPTSTPDSTDDLESRSAIGSLWWTLTRRPDLASKLHRLAMWPQPRSSVSHKIKSTALSSFQTTPIYLATRQVEIRIGEPAIAGIILSLLPRLEKLDYTATDSALVVDFDDWHRTSVPDLLRACNILPADIPLIPAFANLHHLSVQGEDVHWGLINLPGLRHLTLCEYTTVNSPIDISTVPNINSVRIESPHGNFSFMQNLQNMGRFLCLLPKLRKLELCTLRGTNDLVYCALGPPNSQALDMLMASAPDIEELTLTLEIITHLPHLSDLKEEIAQYTKLRKLEVTEYAVIGGCITSPFVRLAPMAWLPPKLEVLIVTYATEKIITWLQKLDKKDFVALRRIELHALSRKDLDRVFESSMAFRHF